MSELSQGNDFPAGKTIEEYLKRKFDKEGRDFKSWVIEFYSPNHARANNIGFYVHYIIEYLVVKNQLRKRRKVYYEISPSDERDTIIDNALIDLSSTPKMWCIDYSTTRYVSNLFDKIYKNYQGIDRGLMIVSLLIDEKIELPKNAKKEVKINTQILNKDKFAKWIGFNEREAEIYYRVIELSKTALYDDEDLRSLEEMGKTAKSRLSKLEKKYPIGENGLIEYLRNVNGKDYTYILRDLKFKKLDTF